MAYFPFKTASLQECRYNVSQKPNLIILLSHWRKKNGSHVFSSSMTGSNKKHTNLTWLPGTRDLECPRHDYFIIWSYDVKGADFKNSLYTFGQSEMS